MDGEPSVSARERSAARRLSVRRSCVAPKPGNAVNCRSEAAEHLLQMLIVDLRRIELQMALNRLPQRENREVTRHREALIRNDDLERRFENRARCRDPGWRAHFAIYSC